jgi:small-conductance mechanosensitive channel
MIPMTLFFIPTVSIVVPAAGYVLATREGIFSFTSSIFIAIIIIGIFLVLTGFLTIVPFSWKFSKELSSENPDEDRISKSLDIISKGALIQMLFQMAIISLMAYIVVFP